MFLLGLLIQKETGRAPSEKKATKRKELKEK
jgi:hypothetical protein